MISSIKTSYIKTPLLTFQSNFSILVPGKTMSLQLVKVPPEESSKKIWSWHLIWDFRGKAIDFFESFYLLFLNFLLGYTLLW